MELKKSFRKRFANMQIKAKQSTDFLNLKSGLLTPNTPVDPTGQDFFSFPSENNSAVTSLDRPKSRTSSVASSANERQSRLSHPSSYEALSARVSSQQAPKLSSSDRSSGVDSSLKSGKNDVFITEQSSSDFDDEVADEMAEKILSVVSSRRASNSWCLS